MLSELLAQLTTQQATNVCMYVKPAQTASHGDCSEDLSGETQHFLGLDTTQLQVAKKKRITMKIVIFKLWFLIINGS